MNVGDILREARERKGLTLSDVENETKIRTKYLAALESEDFKEIPGEAYVLGFLRNYARFLGLDADQILNSYKSRIKAGEEAETVIAPSAAESRQPLATEEKPVAVFMSQKRIFSLILTGIAVAVIIISVIILVLIRSSGLHEPKPNRQEVEKKGTPRIETTVPQSLSIELVATERCWVRVTVDGVEKFSGILNPGMSQKYQAKDSIALRLGNAGGVQVIYNGKKLPPLGDHGDVVDKEFRKSE